MKALCTCFGLMLLFGLPILADDVAGLWAGRLTIKSPVAAELVRTVTLTLNVRGSETGTLTVLWDGHRDNIEIVDGQVNGNMVAFSIPSGASDVPRFDLHGRYVGNELTLEITCKHPRDGHEMSAGDGVLTRGK